MSVAKPWGGRFTEATDAVVEAFTASVHFDQRLYRHDIAASLAHATALRQANVLDDDELRKIEQGLRDILSEINSGHFKWLPGLEDLHMNIEAALVERIGEAGKKLHTGRSRNDQVATDLRLYTREAIDQLGKAIDSLRGALLERAEEEASTAMPGFTHLQTAQPVTLGHHFMAWDAMLERDAQRLADGRRRVNISPLGAGALSGNSYGIDPSIAAAQLGFDGTFSNSLDAVSDRDFAIELASTVALLMVHLSRMAEELVLWCSPLVGFCSLPDRFCTGSSIMPQKKNPDVPELVRGRCARTQGNLISLLTLMKGQPLAYNRDNQEDKEALFDTVDTALSCLTMLAPLIAAMTPEREAMARSAASDFSTATDLADYLTRRGIPFRDAHTLTGRAVALAIERDCTLEELPLEQFQALSTHIDESVYQSLSVAASLAARNHVGGTAPEAVRAAVQAARARLQRS